MHVQRVVAHDELHEVERVRREQRQDQALATGPGLPPRRLRAVPADTHRHFDRAQRAEVVAVVLQPADRVVCRIVWPSTSTRPRARRDRRHACGAARVIGHRLLDQHVTARLERQDRLRLVQPVRRAQHDRLDLRPREHLLEALDGERHAELRGAGARSPEVGVRDRDQPTERRQRRDRARMGARDATAADDRDAEGGSAHQGFPSNEPLATSRRQISASSSTSSRGCCRGRSSQCDSGQSSAFA